MRRLLIICFILALVMTLAVPALAVPSASRVSLFATVSADGSSQVTVTVNLHIDQQVPELTFPVPQGAANVTLNGSRVRVTGGQIDLLGLIGGMTGELSFTLNYTLYNSVSRNEQGALALRLPMLSGFAYPVSLLEFSVTMPGTITARPSFSSGYHQNSIELDLSYSVTGSTISGRSSKELKDHETLEMTLQVEDTLFPGISEPLGRTTTDDLAMAGVAILALLYWLLFLRCPIPRGKATPIPPDGYSAGQLGSILALQGADLTMMVFSWAELGYLQILQDPKGRVYLQKRMDMGNERSAFEHRTFQDLFRRRSVVDTGSVAYANLVRDLERSRSGAARVLKRGSGNPVIFRVLSAAVGFFAGVNVGIGLGTGSALPGFWIALMAVAGGFSGWGMQHMVTSLYLRDKRLLIRGSVLILLWLLLGLLSQELTVCLCFGAYEVLASLLLFWGGRRTETGKLLTQQILGLRLWIRELDRPQLAAALSTDPDFFFTMLPWAMALGVDKALARAFQERKLPPCPFLTADRNEPMTADRWCQQLRNVAASMDWRARQLPLERFRRIVSSVRR